MKSDSVLLYDLSMEGYVNGADIQVQSRDVYGELVERVSDEIRKDLGVTYYERRWLDEGKSTLFN